MGEYVRAMPSLRRLGIDPEARLVREWETRERGFPTPASGNCPASTADRLALTRRRPCCMRSGRQTPLRLVRIGRPRREVGWRRVISPSNADACPFRLGYGGAATSTLSAHALIARADAPVEDVRFVLRDAPSNGSASRTALARAAWHPDVLAALVDSPFQTVPTIAAN